jgi:hypothetical protein
LVQAEPVRLLVVEVLKVQKVRSVALFRRLAVVQGQTQVQKAATARPVEEAVVVLDQEFQLWNDLVMTAELAHSVTRLAVAEDFPPSAVMQSQLPEELVETA